jgi:hypothetical protein
MQPKIHFPWSWYLKIKSWIHVGILLIWKEYLPLYFWFIFSIWKGFRTMTERMILLTHYFCDFNCLLLLLNHTLLREVKSCLCFMCIMIIRDRNCFVNCLLGCIFTWSGSASYVNNPVYLCTKVFSRQLTKLWHVFDCTCFLYFHFFCGSIGQTMFYMCFYIFWKP